MPSVFYFERKVTFSGNINFQRLIQMLLPRWRLGAFYARHSIPPWDNLICVAWLNSVKKKGGLVGLSDAPRIFLINNCGMFFQCQDFFSVFAFVWTLFVMMMGLFLAFMWATSVWKVTMERPWEGIKMIIRLILKVRIAGRWLKNWNCEKLEHRFNFNDRIYARHVDPKNVLSFATTPSNFTLTMVNDESLPFRSLRSSVKSSVYLGPLSAVKLSDWAERKQLCCLFMLCAFVISVRENSN